MTNGNIFQPEAGVTATPFPVDNNTSAAIAYKCAVNIANSFSKLPFPKLNYHVESRDGIPNGAASRKPPRMMPIFSCCAMQSSYVIIMYYHRTMSLIGDHDEGAKTKFLRQLAYEMNHVLDALKNYSIAYEAIGGMPGKLNAMRGRDSTDGITEQIEDTMRRVGFPHV
jgi:hypothetical protein